MPPIQNNKVYLKCICKCRGAMREKTVELGYYHIDKGLEYQSEDFVCQLALSRPQGDGGS